MAVNQRVNVAYGQSQPLVDVFPFPVVARRDPAANDKTELGTIWLNTLTDGAFILTSIVNNVANWETIIGVGGGVFTSLTTTTGPDHLVSTQNAARSIFLDANGGTNETIELFAEQGTGAGSIYIHSAAGGITMLGTALALTGTNASTLQTTGAGQDLTLESQLGSVNIVAGENTPDAITITANGGAAAGISISAANQIELATTTNDGNIFIAANQVTTAGVASTNNAFVGVSTQTGITTVSTAEVTFTITNNKVSATSGILVSVSTLGANDAQLTIQRVVPAAASFTVECLNNGTQSVNGNVIISFMVLS